MKTSTSEQQFERFVTETRQSSRGPERLVALLHEQHPFYKGKSGDAVVRMRGFIFYSFFLFHTPDTALLFIYEELESGKDLYLMTTAAMALRKYERKSEEMCVLLLDSLQKVRYYDSTLSIGHYFPKWPATQETTAVFEILLTLSWLGAYARPCIIDLKRLYENASQYFNKQTMAFLGQVIINIENDPAKIENCCDQELTNFAARTNSDFVTSGVELEDQKGMRTNFKELFSRNKTTLIALFYTRCDNPLKCSLTISNLARIQQLISAQPWSTEVGLAAISYDNEFDRPNQLRRYGEARGIRFNDQLHFFRVAKHFDQFRDFLNLSVNYGANIVNRHSIELFLISPSGEVISTFARARVNPDQIFSEIKAAIISNHLFKKTTPSRLKAIYSGITSLAGSFFIVILPKCPLCFAIYLSMLGIAGAPLIPYVKFIFPALLFVLAINLFLMYRAAKRRNGYLPFYLSTLGALIIVVGYKTLHIPCSETAGFLAIFLASVLNALPSRLFLKIKLRLQFIKLKLAFYGNRQSIQDQPSEFEHPQNSAAHAAHLGSG